MGGSNDVTQPTIICIVGQGAVIGAALSALGIKADSLSTLSSYESQVFIIENTTPTDLSYTLRNYDFDYSIIDPGELQYIFEEIKVRLIPDNNAWRRIVKRINYPYIRNKIVSPRRGREPP